MEASNTTSAARACAKQTATAGEATDWPGQLGNPAKQRENPKGKTDGARLALTSTALLVFLKVGVNKEALPTACQHQRRERLSTHTHTRLTDERRDTWRSHRRRELLTRACVGMVISHVRTEKEGAR
jgi:hypothetical protein